MSKANTGEAKPLTNTASSNIQNINPITFDESALARLLDGAVDKPAEEKPKQDSEVQDPEAEEAVQDPAIADSDVSEASAEDEALSNSDTQEEEVTEEVDESDDAEQPEESQGVQKRIDKLVARARAAEEEIARLKTARDELDNRLREESENKPVAIDPANPLDGIWNYQALEAKKDDMIELRRWCESNAEGYTGKDGREYSAEQIRHVKYNAEDFLEKHIPRRAQFLLEYSQVNPVAEKLFPFWKDRSSQSHAEANEILRLVPQLKSHPTYKVFIGDYLAGRDARLKASAEATKAKAKPTVIAKAPKQPAAPNAAPAKVDPKSAKAKQQKANFLRTGKESELASLLETFL